MQSKSCIIITIYNSHKPSPFSLASRDTTHKLLCNISECSDSRFSNWFMREDRYQLW